LTVAGHGGGLASAELYDPITGQWSVTGNLNVERRGHIAVLLPNGKVLAATGAAGAGVSAEIYDPDSGNWSLTGSLATGRYIPVAISLYH